MPDDAFVRAFTLSPRGDHVGVGCDSNGAFVGPVPLLERATDRFGRAAWQPRLVEHLNRDLSVCYGRLERPTVAAASSGRKTATAAVSESRRNFRKQSRRAKG